MDIFKRFFSAAAAEKQALSEDWSTIPANQASELVVVGDEVDRLSIEFDIEALIVSHERWMPWLAQAADGQIDDQLKPEVIRDERSSELGAWLHDTGRKVLGHLPAYDMLVVRNRYFHVKAAELVTHAAHGESMRSDLTFKQLQHASRQMVLLLKELKRGLVRNPSRMSAKTVVAPRAR